MVSTIHARLRSDTGAVHLELERHLALLGPNVSMVRYTRIIALFYGFYRPLEAGLDRLNAGAPARGFPLRARTELLERDLLALGLEMQAITELPTCRDLPSNGQPHTDGRVSRGRESPVECRAHVIDQSTIIRDPMGRHLPIQLHLCVLEQMLEILSMATGRRIEFAVGSQFRERKGACLQG
jgi:hypothetical protein